jgi:cysteine desulfurase / selenocysteine lyase
MTRDVPLGSNAFLRLEAAPPVPEAVPAAVLPGAAVPASRPGAPIPGASVPGAAIDMPGVPEAVPAALLPGAAVPTSRPGAPIPGKWASGAVLSAPAVPEAMASAVVPGETVPMSRADTPILGGSAPGATTRMPAAHPAIPATVVPGTAVPMTLSGGAMIPNTSIPGSPAPFPGVVELPSTAQGMDGALPRLFGDAEPSASVSAAPGTPGYYFLTPTLATRSSPGSSFSRRIFDVRDIRRDFPILQERVHGKPLVWLDNAATTQKPRAVIQRLVHYYEHEYSNVHRGAHTLAARSTDAYEGAREKLARFVGASSPSEVVFVRGTTEAINLVASSWGRRHIGAGDEIVLTTLEHHSNIVPWQFVADEVGAVIRVVPVTDRGEVMLDDYGKLLGPRTRMVAFTHVSNALGTILPAQEMVQMAHRVGARVLIDGAQAVAHFPVNVQTLDADFYVLSGHKLFGPSGVGVLYGKKALLDEMPPWQGGGNMIQRVTFEKSTFADPPARFEAGTATLAPAVGLGAAVDYLDRIGMVNVAFHERELMAYATETLSQISGLRMIGTAPEKAGAMSFVVDGISAEDMGRILDQDGIAVRAGHHCAQPTMDRFGVDATVRPSLAVYNNHADIDTLVRAVRRALRH